ncbi:hypothetical protein [Plantactinospora soyae]|uniref:Uncharacterized protein n=1 Tax=Plantactinospora soyae TaxID=1544732 RepID=A0A927QYK4_9ACTN|nr:hypothetical protein [Plantactinospora soyae]MBE1487967.1 hypothetical protein [Plantactinospora soyae]
MVPKPGDVLLLDGRASVQFAGGRRLLLRVTVVADRPTYYGWCWLTGYVLDQSGRAVDRREVFVRLAGLCLVAPRSRRAGQSVGAVALVGGRGV